MQGVPDPIRLLDWYDRSRRDLPWRAQPGERADPYRVWLSEIMLQQTTVATVIPYFQAFVARWPTVADLAGASLDDVLVAWAGLGYYARARNLHKCARALLETHSGHFPADEAGLRTLPGVGVYTAAAVAAIALGQRAVAVDGNIERVVARLFAVTAPLPSAKATLYGLADRITPAERCGDFIQAAMDLGATICTPRSPACVICPWRDDCQGRQQGIAESLPRKALAAERPTRHGIAFWVERRDGSVLLRRRPEKGLLGGMMEVPSTPWRGEPWTLAEAVAEAPLALDWIELAGGVRHTFTHFHLELIVVAGRVGSQAVARGVWVPIDHLGGQALPTVMRKVATLAIRRTH